jgi:hypothetical protein
MIWEDLIFDLMRAGLTGAKIAENIGIPPTTLNALKNGETQQPRWPAGDALIKLHARYDHAGLIPRKDRKLGAALPDAPHQTPHA